MDEQIRAYEDAVAAATTPRDKVDALNDLAWKIRRREPQRARTLCEEAQALLPACDPPHRDGEAYALLITSVLEWEQSSYQIALPLALEALALFRATGNDYRQACTLVHLAGIHFFLGNYSQALELALDGLRLSEDSSDRNLRAALLNNIGYLYLHLEQFPDALPQLTKALDMHRATGNTPGEAETLDSISRAYLLMDDYAQALEYDQRSLALFHEIGYRRGEVEISLHIGRIYVAQGDYAQALATFEQALALAQEDDYKQFIAAALAAIGRIHTRRGHTAQAIPRLQEALAVAEGIGAKQLIFESHEALADAYEQAGELALALQHYRQFHAAKEAVFNEKTDQRLRSLQVMHQVEAAKRQAEIAELRNNALQQEIEEREKLIAELNAFAYTVAHDLKNPLAVIVGYGEIIEDSLDREDLSGLREMVVSLQRMGQKASHIINELLLLARVRQEDIQPEPLDMAAVIAEVRDRLANRLDAVQAALHVPDDWPLALGYAPWVEEVWVNYISNAIKYGGDPPRIELGADRGDGQVRFWVRDNGDGIAPAQQDRLFTPFNRLDGSQAKGHGLGLSIVRRIVHKLGGNVGVESAGRPGAGSLFFFTLPVAGAVTD